MVGYQLSLQGIGDAGRAIAANWRRYTREHDNEGAGKHVPSVEYEAYDLEFAVRFVLNQYL